MLKKINFLYLLLGLGSNLMAQTMPVPNGGFEEWRVYPFTIYETPLCWTDNDLLYQHFDPGYKGVTLIKTTRSHSGKYALQLGVSFNHNDTVNGGIYSTGSMDSLMRLLYHTAAAGFPVLPEIRELYGLLYF